MDAAHCYAILSSARTPNPGRHETTTNDKDTRRETNTRTLPKRPNRTIYTGREDIRKKREREKQHERQDGGRERQYARLWTNRLARLTTNRRQRHDEDKPMLIKGPLLRCRHAQHPPHPPSNQLPRQTSTRSSSTGKVWPHPRWGRIAVSTFGVRHTPNTLLVTWILSPPVV